MRMPGEYGLNLLCLEMIIAVNDDDTLVIDDGTFAGLSAVIGVSEEMLRSIHATWKRWPDRRSPFKAPDDVFTGGTLPPVH
jgi:hypothetical protein